MTSSLPAEPAAPRRVFFDFDGTLVKDDTVLLFLGRLLRAGPWRLLLAWPAVLGALVLQVSTGTCSAGLSLAVWALTLFLSEERFERHCVEFAEDLVRGGLEPRLVRSAVQRLRAHLEAGDEVFVVSGSGQAWLEPLVRHLFGPGPKVVGTRFCRRLGGMTLRDRCYREKKIALLAEVAPGPLRFAAGYSDSENDRPVLDLCERPFRVDKHRDRLERFPG